MKKIILIPMFLLMLSLASYSQNGQVYQPDTILIYADTSIVEFDSMFLFIPSDESAKVYPHVILGGTGCTAQINTSTAIWAEQDIIFDKGFELSANTAFSARVISVPDPMNSELYKHNSHK